MREDEVLVREILDGDRESFAALMDQYKPLVIHIVYRMIRTEADREDLLQDVFVRVYENLGGFRFKSKLSTWIARIAHNTCINFIGKKREVLVDDEFPGGPVSGITICSAGLTLGSHCYTQCRDQTPFRKRGLAPHWESIVEEDRDQDR